MDVPHITIIRSPRRKRTIQSKYRDGHLWIYLPSGMSRTEEDKWVNKMIQRNQRSEEKRRIRKSDTWLMHRAQMFNKKYFNGALEFSITYVSNQNSRFGSCTSTDGTIRISEHVKTMPSWVQDYVIIHELTHLIYQDHSKEFWEIVNQYEYAERAKGYLIAIGSGAAEQNS